MKTTVMKPLEVKELPPKGNKIYELKYDGGSCVIEKKGARIGIWHNDNGTNMIYKYPKLVKDLKTNAVKDGTYVAELCVITPSFKGGDFSLFLKRQCENNFKITQRSEKYPITAVFYDIVKDGDTDVSSENLLGRKKKLADNIKETDHIKLIKYHKSPDNFLKLKDKIEGFVIKNIDAVYRFNTRVGWYKYRFNKESTVKCITYEDHPKGIVLISDEEHRYNLPGARSRIARSIIDQKGYVMVEISSYKKRNAVVKRVIETIGD